MSKLFFIFFLLLFGNSTGCASSYPCALEMDVSDLEKVGRISLKLSNALSSGVRKDDLHEMRNWQCEEAYSNEYGSVFFWSKNIVTDGKNKRLIIDFKPYTWLFYRHPGMHYITPELSVHNGLHIVFNGITSPMEKILSEKNLKDYDIVLTGEGVGGTLALVAAAEIFKKESFGDLKISEFKKNQMKIITFYASPPGNFFLSEYLEKQLDISNILNVTSKLTWTHPSLFYGFHNVGIPAYILFHERMRDKFFGYLTKSALALETLVFFSLMDRFSLEELAPVLMYSLSSHQYGLIACMSVSLICCYFDRNISRRTLIDLFSYCKKEYEALKGEESEKIRMAGTSSFLSLDRNPLALFLYRKFFLRS